MTEWSDKLLADIIVDNDDILLSTFKAYVTHLGISLEQYLVACDKYTEKIMGTETPATVSDKANMRHMLLKGIRKLNPDDVKNTRHGLTDRKFKILMSILKVKNVDVSIEIEGGAYTPRSSKVIDPNYLFATHIIYPPNKFMKTMIRDKKEEQ